MINIFFNFTIEYFSIMYVTVATIYLLAAIFIFKTELMKKQAEVMKIVEAQQIVKKQLEEQEKENKKEQEEKEERQKKDKEEETKDKKQEKKENKENKGNVNHDEPEGSNA